MRLIIFLFILYSCSYKKNDEKSDVSTFYQEKVMDINDEFTWIGRINEKIPVFLHTE